METMNRRSLLKTGFLGGLSLGLTGLVARNAVAGEALERGAANDAGGYGKMAPTAAQNTGQKLIALPEGFSYNVFGRTGDKMADGHRTPGAHDGMATFWVDGKIRIVRNHELRGQPSESVASASKSYDPTAGGGTTTLVVDPVSRMLERDWVSLSGTLVNCAGGPTPWGTWLSCEETCAGKGLSQVYHKDKEQGGGYAKEHGYIFEVSVTNNEVRRIEPYKAMGRYVHEAIAVDPTTGIVYETEDAGEAGFFRFIPKVPGKLAEGGQLEMARIKGQPKFDTRRGQKAGVKYEIDWVPIEDPDPKDAFSRPDSVFKEGQSKGGATFARLEGCWYGNGFIYLNATNGGDAKRGQIWRYRPIGFAGGELTLLFESPGAEVLDMPDNLCVSPRGGLVVCEDGDGQNFIRGLTPDGRLFDFAANVYNDSEFAGSCFGPDGNTLFVNIQNPGITLAIWGPWERGMF